MQMWLHREHMALFRIYVATLVCDLSVGAINVWGPEKWFTSPTHVHQFNMASHEVWGWAFLVAGAIMLVGLFAPTFEVARVGLTIAAILNLARASLIGASILTGDAIAAGGVPFFFLAAFCHLAQVLEPVRSPR
jgi:hypothetical protein